MPVPIRISVTDGTLNCTPNAGNISAKVGETIQWVAGDNVREFRLRFFKAPVQGNPATTNWPFSKASAEDNALVPAFEGLLDEKPGIFKYTVEVETGAQTYFLDPMIIVSR